MTDIFRKNGAKAIWIDNEKKLNRYVKFQTEFDAEGKDAFFYICTDKQYELYINGKMVSFGQYGDYPKEKVYDTVDISSYIKKGKNLVSILAHSNGIDSFCHVSGLPMVIFALTENGQCILKSDDTVKCSEDTEFTSGEFENITGQLTFNFGFDLRKDDFFRETLVSENWQNAVICDDKEVEYIPRPIKKLVLDDVCRGEIITQGEFEITEGDTISKMMQFANLAYRSKDVVFEENDGCPGIKKDNTFYIADLGKELAGHIVIDVEAEDGAVLDIAYGEHLADMRVRSYVGGRNFAFRTVCREGRQKISFYIHRIAGRYLEIFAHKGIKKVYTIGLHSVRYPLHYNPLKFSHSFYNKIYGVSQHTLMLCMHEHYEDCPWREQALYGMDSRNQMLAGYYAFGETDMPRESLRLLAQSQKESGLLDLTAPNNFRFTIPSFSLAWVTALAEYVLFSGDTDFAREMLPVAKKLLAFFEIDSEKKILQTPTGRDIWNFYEWTDGMNTSWNADLDIRYDAPLNALYMLALRKYLDLCLWTDNREEATRTQGVIDTIKEGFHKAFYCEDKKAYKTYIDENEPHFSQLTQAWAICGGCVPEGYEDIIRESVVNDEFVKISLSHSVYKYDALMQSADKYAEYVIRDIEENWGHMLYSGATTFWETILGEKDFGSAGSLCHGWSATPAYVFWRYVIGIYPKAPGFKEISVEPLCGDTFRAEGELKTPAAVYKVTHKHGETKIV